MTASLEALLATGNIAAHALLTQSQEATRVALELRERVKPGTRVLLAQHPERSVWSKLSGLLRARERISRSPRRRCIPTSVVEQPQDTRSILAVLRLAGRAPRRRSDRLMRSRALSSRTDGPDAADLLARGMLLAGLEEPRVVIHTPELVAVTARVPALRDALDQVFLHKPRNL